jgi:hypothetical protein
MAVGSGMVVVKLQPRHCQLTYTRNIPNVFCETPPEDEHLMPLIINKLNGK